MWTEIQWVEREEQDDFVDIQLVVQQVTPSYLPRDPIPLGTWAQVQEQFRLDFPRCAVYLDGVQLQTPDQCMLRLRQCTGEEAQVRALVGLCTQGALAQAYHRLCQLHPRPLHVLSAPERQRIHICLDSERVSVHHTKAFVLARIQEGEMRHPRHIQLELALSPHEEGEMRVVEPC